MTALTDRELQSLRNEGNEAERAADEIVALRVEVERLRAAPAPVAQTNTDRALGALRAMRSKDAIAHRERMANAPKGACESCYGDGEIGGQFCDGFEPCAECGGTGRANGGEATGQEGGAL